MSRNGLPIDWARLAPDKGSPVPRYAQLADGIAGLIRSGALPAGAQLPPERDLAEAAGISRMTARQALAWLARQGVLDIRHGVGVFVAAPRHTLDALHLFGFSEEARRHGLDASTRTLAQRLLAPDPDAARALQLAPGEEVVELVRLRLAGGEPLLLQRSLLPAALVPGLERADLERGSLYDLLRNRHGIVLAAASQTVAAACADAEAATLLGIPPGGPLLLVEGVARDDRERPIEAFSARYRADRVRLSLESRRAPGPTSGVALAVAQEVSVVLT